MQVLTYKAPITRAHYPLSIIVFVVYLFPVLLLHFFQLTFISHVCMVGVVVVVGTSCSICLYSLCSCEAPQPPMPPVYSPVTSRTFSSSDISFSISNVSL